MGLSFRELARIDVPTFSAACTLWGGGEVGDDEDHIRQAGQSDIDNLFK